MISFCIREKNISVCVRFSTIINDSRSTAKYRGLGDNSEWLKSVIYYYDGNHLRRERNSGSLHRCLKSLPLFLLKL